MSNATNSTVWVAQNDGTLLPATFVQPLIWGRAFVQYENGTEARVERARLVIA